MDVRGWPPPVSGQRLLAGGRGVLLPADGAVDVKHTLSHENRSAVSVHGATQPLSRGERALVLARSAADPSVASVSSSVSSVNALELAIQHDIQRICADRRIRSASEACHVSKRSDIAGDVEAAPPSVNTPLLNAKYQQRDHARPPRKKIKAETVTAAASSAASSFYAVAPPLADEQARNMPKIRNKAARPVIPSGATKVRNEAAPHDIQSVQHPRLLSSDLTEELRAAVSQPAKDGIANAAVEELYRPLKVCVVCDEIIAILHEDDARTLEPSMLDRRMRALLSGADIEPPLPQSLRLQYVADNSLSDLLLSPRGVVSRCPLTMTACATCWNALRRHRIPPFAICNSFAIGKGPADFDAASETEQALVTPIQRYARFFRLGAERQLQIRGHMSSQKLDVAKVADALPLRLEHLELRILVAAAFTTAQKERALKDFEINGARVRRILKWLKENNRVYNDIQIDVAALESLPVQAVPDALVSEEQADEVNTKPAASSPADCAAAAATEEVLIRRDATLRFPTQNNSFEETAVALRSMLTVNNKEQRTYVVRSSSEPHWANTPTWFAASHPLLMPYGRGGPDEKRAVRVGMTACFEHYCRLSTRQFQGAKDALAMYDAISTEAVKTQVFVTAKWRTQVGSDSAPFGVLSVQDLQTTIAYNEGMASSQREGRRGPDVPSGLSADAKRFLETVKTCTQNAQHTVDHALRVRKDLFSMGYAMGPATWWLTVSPDDLGSLLVYEMATGDRPTVIPLAEIRSEIVANRPGAAALAFERLQTIVIRFVLGWDQKKKRPYQFLVTEQQDTKDAGGLLGVCRAFAIANETQARGSLHMHILMWSQGHDNIAQRIRARAASDDTQRACAELVRLLEGSYTSELQFPASVVDEIHRCPRAQCDGALKAAPEATIAALRKRNTTTTDGPLICDRCKRSQHCAKHIASVVEQRLVASESPLSLAKNDPTHQRQRAQFKWDIQHRTRWPNDKTGLFAGVMQALSNTHRAEHTHTCWKKKQAATSCRFRFPQISQLHTAVDYAHDKADDRSSLHFAVRRRPAFAYVASFSPDVHRICLSNTNLQFVTNHEVSFYMTMYATKVNREEANANASVVNAFRRNVMRSVAVPQDLAVVQSTRYAAGISQMLSATYGWTSADAVSAQAAAFYNLGGTSFVFSHEFASLPVRQGIAFLEGDVIHATVNRTGTASASIFDYAFRPNGEQFDGLCWYEFVERYEAVRKSTSRKTSVHEYDVFNEDDDPDADEVQEEVATQQKRRGGRDARTKFPLAAGHPSRAIRNISERTSSCIVSIIGQRLGNIQELDSGQSTDLDAAREDYAQSVLVIFVPFRTIADLKSNTESWWAAFQRHRVVLAANRAIFSVIENMQRYHHEFSVASLEERVLSADDGGADDQKAEAEAADLIDTDEEVDELDLTTMPGAQAILARLGRVHMAPQARTAAARDAIRV